MAQETGVSFDIHQDYLPSWSLAFLLGNAAIAVVLYALWRLLIGVVVRWRARIGWDTAKRVGPFLMMCSLPLFGLAGVGGDSTVLQIVGGVIAVIVAIVNIPSLLFLLPVSLFADNLNGWLQVPLYIASICASWWVFFAYLEWRAYLYEWTLLDLRG
jgi:hypothetical protein